MAILTQAEVKTELMSMRGWTLHDGKEIRKEFTHKHFVEAMSFVTAVALLAQRANHHPDIDIRWGTVRLALSTHSEGGITQKDIALAKEIDKAARES